MKFNKISVEYPVKYVEFQDGVIFLFETSQSSLLPNPSIVVEKFNDGFFLIIEQQFFIPVKALNITSKSKIIKLYLASSTPTTQKADIFSTITLDDKIIGKLLGIIEMF